MGFIGNSLAVANKNKQYSVFAQRVSYKLSCLPIELSYFLLNLPPVERLFLQPKYQKYVQSNQHQTPQLDPIDVNIVNGLERTGVYVTSLDNLGVPNTAQFLEAANTLCRELAETADLPRSRGKDKIRASGAQLVKYSDVYHWGLEDRLLNIAESYLKLPAAYGYPTFSLHVAKWSHERSGYWHKDREDRRMLKIGIYFNDVNEDSGPFEYVRPEDNALLFDLLKKKYPVIQTYKTLLHKPLENLLPTSKSNWLQSCTGKAGTVIFVDPTRVYHRGKPPTEGNRFAVFFGYHSRRPAYPFSCGLSHFSSRDGQSLTEPLSKRQQECINWRDELSGVAKRALHFGL